ncbi:hypothetical protein B296_00014002 [Ensete ventricosum]|uniref:Uncharacterized protein n=1 Tax=Ensete ventricosum TaxID=4639 RepID=A0A426ZU38_ENSVE|nr:hypothetical protein B296_00014002 [Ensete ventricosum]
MVRVVALLGAVIVVSIEVTVSFFVMTPDLCSDWVRGPEESLVSDLENDLVELELFGELVKGQNGRRLYLIVPHLSQSTKCRGKGFSIVASTGGCGAPPGCSPWDDLDWVLPAATSAEGHTDVGASALGPVEGCRAQWLGSSQ